MEIQVPLFNTLKDICDWFGFPGPEPVGCDFMLQEIDQWNKNKLLRAPAIYKANFFTVLIVSEGSAAFRYNGQAIRLESSSISIAGPAHSRSFVFDDIAQACFICFTENFLASYCFSDVYGEFPFLLSESLIYTEVDPENYQLIRNNTNQIKQEIQRVPAQKMLLVANMVEFLLIKVKELLQNQTVPVAENKNSTVFNAFYNDLGQYFDEILTGKRPKQLKAKDFAELQFLNEEYFSRIIKSKTGRTPTAWINSRLLSEAKILLTETSQPTAKIASLFQFTSARYFILYFKKQTTLTPNHYRKSLQKKWKP